MPVDKSGKHDKQTKSGLEEEVWSAIAAFEQILEAMPNDRASLEALQHAYEQIGDHVKAKEYLIRLAKVFAEEGDFEAGAGIVNKLKAYADDDPVAAELASTFEAFAKPEETPAKGKSTSGGEEQKAEIKETVHKPNFQIRTTLNMADELAFAWNLLEAKELTQEEYASVVQDLTEMSTSESMVTVSVLHALEARGFKNIERVLAYVAKECGTPIILLSFFSFTYELVTILSMELMVRRGVFVFDKIGNDLLVVIMNPYDNQLKKDIETYTGRKCHFYVTLPSEFDKAILKATEIIAEKESQEKT